VLHPGATDERRRWPAACFSALAVELGRHGCRVAVTGDASERALVADVVAGAELDALDLAGKLSLRALVGLLAGAEVVVSNDTGPLHVADAVGARTVGIYWGGNLINGGTPLRARHTPLASWRQACPTCGADNTHRRCPHDPSFVADVAFSDVLAAAVEHLGATAT
jgi:ADP-heptose:LPS heptosyltransferase